MSDKMVEEAAVCPQADKPLQRWFAVHVKPRSEKTVALIAGNRGYEAFLPLQKVRRRWSDRVKQLEIPLFPGYIFCRLAVAHRLPLLMTPGVLGLVGVGRTPLPIEDTEILNIQAVVNSGLWAEPCAFLESGQSVRLEEGPLAGLEGLYVESRSEHRIVVSVSLLRRSVAIEIEREWVRPLRNGNLKTQVQAAPLRLAGISR
jgi:transcription antitermination factor NusG